jgi:hypothetical protein
MDAWIHFEENEAVLARDTDVDVVNDVGVEVHVTDYRCPQAIS